MTTTEAPTGHPAYTDETTEDEVLVHLGLTTQPVHSLSFRDRVDDLQTLRHEVHRLAVAHDQSSRREAELARTNVMLRQDHERFCEAVRDKAKQVAEDQNWCRTGLNDAMDEPGLALFTTTYLIKATVTAHFTVTDTEDRFTTQSAVSVIEGSIRGIDCSQPEHTELEDWRIESVAVVDVAHE